MMRIVAMCLCLLTAGALTAQQSSTSMPVRSITLKLVSTSSEALNSIGLDAIAAALKGKGIQLAVEGRFDPSQVEKAADVIRDMYGDQGQKVRVEHSVTQMRPHSVGVAFEVVQLYSCN
jgi:hypothetical protein